MILIKKTAQYAINIHLDESGINSMKEYLESDKKDHLAISKDSTGFDNKSIYFIKITTEGRDEVNQLENVLTMNIDEDDIKYFIFKLNQYSIEKDFIPEELFSVTNQKKQVTINFFLSKYQQTKN